MMRFIRNILIFLIVIISALWLLLKVEIVQKKAIEKFEQVVFNATGMHITIDHLSLSFPGSIDVEGLLIQDQSNF